MGGCRARRSLAGLGSVSERVVRYRIGRLVTAGIIHIGAIANPRSLGYNVVADVFLQVDAASVLDVARKLTEFECVSYVGSSMGETDVSVQVVGHDNAEVYAFVTDVIAKIPGRAQDLHGHRPAGAEGCVPVADPVIRLRGQAGRGRDRTVALADCCIGVST